MALVYTEANPSFQKRQLCVPAALSPVWEGAKQQDTPTQPLGGHCATCSPSERMSWDGPRPQAPASSFLVLILYSENLLISPCFLLCG